MTETTHTYRAFLLGTPEHELQIEDDDSSHITLDAGQAPHILAGLALKPQSMAILDALDPRGSARVRVECTMTGQTGPAVLRTFDLGLRRRSVAQADALALVELASDEAMLDDYRPLTDRSLFYSQHSLRAIVEEVLGVAIPGATLAPGTIDPPVRAVIDSTNLVRNPRAQHNTADWASAAPLLRETIGGPADAPSLSLIHI